ncbi:MAG: hypothetical protein SFU85_02315 [Candidatus Methylacidiphilales bacterium]|nr:hypothetical protein [Candidatus Methylacidiphilales bacterium]
MRFIPIFLVLSAILAATGASRLAAADALDEIQRYSGIRNVDPAKLAAGQIVGTRIPAEGSDLTISVETLYALPLTPEQAVRRMVDSDSATQAQASETLDLEGHFPVRVPAQEADFARLVISPEDGLGRALIKASASGSGLNLNAVEAKLLADAPDPASLSGAWRKMLAERARTFQSRGWVGSPAYDNGGRGFNMHQEMVRLLKAQPALLERFKDSIGAAMTAKLAPGMETPSYYWETSRIQGDRTFTLAAVFNRRLEDGSFQVVEPTYYVSSKYYTSLILYEVRPAVFNGVPHSVVWRGDFVITPSINFLKGIERIAAENITLIEVKKSVQSFIEECRTAK